MLAVTRKNRIEHPQNRLLSAIWEVDRLALICLGIVRESPRVEGIPTVQAHIRHVIRFVITGPPEISFEGVEVSNLRDSISGNSNQDLCLTR
jgi:hypothetical protein